MTKRLLHFQIPLYLAVLILLTVLALGVFLFGYFTTRTYNYEVVLPENNGSRASLQYGSWPALANAGFFTETKNSFIAQRASFIEADLSSMKLRVYVEGVLQKEVSILTKGREGSWWETPAGLYKIETKEKNHFSSFGKVYQPWSLAFQGNFFIHGWPYYPNGTPVASSYSGGCIRLSSEDAEAVFSLVYVGTPVLVFEHDFASDNFVYREKTPLITGESYLAADVRSNSVLLEKNSDGVLPIASLAKLVTALVAAEYINLDKEIEITKPMIVKTSKPRLKIGQKVTAFNLLYPLLLESSNEAAQAFAFTLGEDRFVSLMNQKAKALGMDHTHFADATGASAGNVSTAQDLFNLGKYLYNNRSFILNLSAGKLLTSAYGRPQFANLENFNVFQDDPQFVGGKVGDTTQARQTILSIFNLTIASDTRPLAIIVLGSSDRAKDAATILNYIREQY